MPFLPVARLAPQDRVAVVAPAGPFDRTSFDAGLSVLNARYSCVPSPHLFDTHRYLAGTEAARLDDLQHAFDDDSIKAVFSARGGYGSMHLLPQLKLTARAFVGFSDVTAVHLALQARGHRSLHGPVLTQLGKQSVTVIARLFDALEGRPLAPLSGTTTLTKGVAEGPLVGGNLSVLTRLIGTPFLPSLKGAVLLIEDVGERPYRIDRMWTHLRLAGLLDGLAGIVFGEFTQCEEKDASWTLMDVVSELVKQGPQVPCAAGFNIGHGAVNEPVVLGARVRLDATQQTLTTLEGLS